MIGGTKTGNSTTSVLDLQQYGYPEGTNSAATAVNSTVSANNEAQNSLNNTFKSGGSSKTINKKQKAHKKTRKNKKNCMYILTYVFKANIANKRKHLRNSHLQLCKKYENNKTLLLGGPVDGNKEDIFIFTCKRSAKEFHNKDSYVREKLVKESKIKKFEPTVGYLNFSKLFNMKGGDGTTAVTTFSASNSGSNVSSVNANSISASNTSTVLQSNENAKWDGCVGLSASACGQS